MELGLQSRQNLAWKPFTTVRLPARRASGAARPIRVPKAHNNEAGRQQADSSAQTTLLAAFLALSTAMGLPHQAEAKTAVAPPEKPTEYDALQKIVADRAGSAGSLLESFKKGAATTAAAAVAAVPTPPAAPSLTAESAQPLPKAPEVQAKLSNVAEDVQQATQDADLPQPASLGALAAVLGLGGAGGLALFSNKGSSPERAAKRVAPRAQVGTRKVGTAVRQAAKQAPAPVRAAIGGVKAGARQPARQAGGLFSRGTQPVKALKKVAPAATKKVQRAGTKRVGSLRTGAGTVRTGGRKGAPPSRRVQLDDDAKTTIGAAGALGLGLAVSGFLLVSVLTGVETTAGTQPANAQQEITKRLPDVPNPLPAKPLEALKAAPEKIAGAAPQAAQQVEAAAPVAQKAQEVLPQVADAELPKQSAAFEEAAKKLADAPSAAEQFRAATTTAPSTEKKSAPIVTPALPVPKGLGQTPKAPATPAPSLGAPAGGAAAAPSNNNVLIVGGLLVAAAGAIAVGAPKSQGVQDAVKDAANSAGAAVDSAKQSTASGSSGSSSGGTDVKEDIADRKKEAQSWISEWRETTGGK